jgi:hypothetical protein
MDPTTVSFEDFVAMSGAAKAMGLEKMCAHYNIDLAKWTQISGGWTQAMGREMHKYASYGVLVEQEAARIQAGGAPRPVTSGGASAVAMAPTQIAPPGGYAAPAPQPAPGHPQPAQVAQPGYAPPPQAPQHGYPPPAGHPQQPGQAYPPQYPQQPGQAHNQHVQSFDQQASKAVNAVGDAAVAGLNALDSAFGSFAKSISGPTVGGRVLVQWSDGNRYPATVVQLAQGQVYVAMQDGRQIWVPQQFVFTS